MICKLLILGGYGNFGKRIAEGLKDVDGLTIMISGRSREKAEQACIVLNGLTGATIFESVAIDVNSPEFTAQLLTISPDITIHTSGPFQGQDYHVPEACIEAGSHYIDLGDDRRFVCDIVSLDSKAKEANVTVVSGASSVPGLSSTVIDHYKREFSEIESIDFGIAPGNKAEVGEATLRGILSYTGHKFKIYENGEWVETRGWTRPRNIHFGGIVGSRWLADIDIPDLELFPSRYENVQTVRFQAGLELVFLHFIMFTMAQLVKIGLVSNWVPLAKPIMQIRGLFKWLGSDIGGMRIKIKGSDSAGNDKEVKWALYAANNVGPYIPTLSAIILAKKLITGELVIAGAAPCLGLFSLEEFSIEAEPWGIFYDTEVIGG